MPRILLALTHPLFMDELAKCFVQHIVDFVHAKLFLEVADGSIFVPYETMFRAFELTDDKDRVIRAVRIMAEKTGIYGMLGGQSVDVENDGKPLEKDLLDYIYEHKTSALIEASMMAGAVLAGADEEQTSMIEQAASDIGLAFQIQDDILDVTSTSQELGKPVHSDEKNNKVTYVTLFGVQKASEQVRELSEKALAVLDRLYNKNEFLTELVMEMATRRK